MAATISLAKMLDKNLRVIVSKAHVLARAAQAGRSNGDVDTAGPGARGSREAACRTAPRNAHICRYGFRWSP